MTCGRSYGYHAFYPFFGEASPDSCTSGSDRDQSSPTGASGWGCSWRHRKYKGHYGASGRAFERRIPIDVTEARDSLQIVADVPGASKDAINIEAEKGLLTISVAAMKSMFPPPLVPVTRALAHPRGPRTAGCSSSSARRHSRSARWSCRRRRMASRRRRPAQMACSRSPCPRRWCQRRRRGCPSCRSRS